MSVTLDLPAHILERASNRAAAEGISLDALIARYVETMSEQELLAPATMSEPIQKMGLFPGSVLYMAEDFDEIPEGFEGK